MSVGYIDTGAELQGGGADDLGHMVAACSLPAAVAAEPASKAAELRLSVTASPPEDPKHTTVRLCAAQSSRETRKKKALKT